MENRKNRLVLVSFFLNVSFLFLIIIFCDMKYEVSDDFVVDAILSGAYGSGFDPHLLFSNILLGYLLKGIYQLIPVVSWYFILHIVLCFLSLWAVTYIILEQNHRYVGILLSIVFISFFSNDLYLLVQFTKTAAAATCAGGVLFLYGFWKKQKKYVCMICGALLALLGSMIRFYNVYLSLVFLALIFIRYGWEERGSVGFNRRLIYGVIASGWLIGGAYGLRAIDRQLWSRDTIYADYKTFNSIRASVTDIQGYGYESIADGYDELGLSETDHKMFSSWNFLDKERYTPELLRQVAKIKRECNFSMQRSLKKLVKEFLVRHYESYVPALGVVVVLLLFVILERRKLLWQLMESGVAAVLLLYFFYRGRVVYRVEYSIFLCLAVSLVTAFEVTDIKQEHKKTFVCWCIAFCLCKIPLYIPDRSYEIMSDGEYMQYIYDVFFRSWDYDLRKYRCNVNEREPYGNLTAYMERDTEHHYLLDFGTTIQLVYYNYKPWLRVPEGLWKNYSYLGGVNMGYPDTYQLWEELGIDTENPYKSLVNENIYVVDNVNYETKLNYLREHYYPDARMELVGIIDEFMIWKYFRE